MEQIRDLLIESPSFVDNGPMPKLHTGFDRDLSPEFRLFHVSDRTVSIAIIMDDLDIPMIRAYNHWLIWNIPVTEVIGGGIPHGPALPSLGHAVQGIGYGQHRYRGPKQPVFVRNTHRYIFRFYTLDCFLELSSDARKRELLAAMDGHIIQEGSITGTYKR